MAAELTMSEDGARAMQEAENLCWRANVAILSAEHLLAGTFIELAKQDVSGLPDVAAVEAALLTLHGTGHEKLTQNVMWGSAAREALNAAALRLRQRGGTVLDSREIALGILESGEVNPMFYAAANATRDAWRKALTDSDKWASWRKVARPEQIVEG